MATEQEIAGGTGIVNVIEVTDGQVTIQGLDANFTYWLVETEAPVGYNKLTGHIDFMLSADDGKATVEGNKYVTGGFKVENNTGTELPSTGGMGTTLLYLAGGALVLLALVLLITKKRMGNAE